MKSEQLSLDSHLVPAAPFTHSSVAEDHGVILVDAAHPLRARAEAYIKQVYRRVFSAQVNHFSAQLLVKLDAQQRIIGTVGLTLAGKQALFVEQYLSQPVTHLLAADPNAQARTEQKIVEIGNLAMVDRCSVRQVICFLSQFMLEQKVDWVVFTARTELLNSFKRLGLPLTHLADASRDSIDDNNDTWGSYYAGSPKVVAGRLQDVLSLQTVTETAQSAANPSPDCSALLTMIALPGLGKAAWI